MRFVLKLAIIIVAVAAGSLFWLPDALQQRGRGVETPQTEVGQQPGRHGRAFRGCLLRYDSRCPEPGSVESNQDQPDPS